MDRFASSNQQNIQNLIQKSKNENTTRATNQWMRVYHSWAQQRNAPLDIELLPPSELDPLLQTFYAEIRKQNGKDYEPSCLANMLSGIDRYLKEKQYKFSIVRDREFSTSKSVLEGKARILRENGMGKRPNKAESLTRSEEEILWTSDQFGAKTPMSLINTIWWQLSQHFGLRGRQEHHSMKVEDFVFKKDDKNNEYVTFSEGITKTRKSGLHEVNRAAIPKMFATNTTRCPVSFLRLYLSKRPLNLRSSGPLYLAVIHNPATDVWYKSSRMGQHTIDNLMKRMVENSPLKDEIAAGRSKPKKLTNHSVRKTGVKTLKSNGYSKSEIIAVTGHNSEKGLDAYDSGDETQQRQMSHAIDHVPSSTNLSTTTNSQSS